MTVVNFGRRCDFRYGVTQWPEGVLRVLRDVMVQRIDANELVAISREVPLTDETLTLELTVDSGACRSEVRVRESRPIIIDGSVRHRLRLQVSGTGAGADSRVGGVTDRWQAAVPSENGRHPDLISNYAPGVLTRERRVHVINVSASGALLESAGRIEVGLVGSLRLLVRGQKYADDVLVVRCRSIEGAGSTCRFGVQFLWTDRPHESSLHHAMRRGLIDLISGADAASAV